MESYKQEKIIIIMYEYLNDKREFYPISNVPLDKAKFFYKDDDGLFKLMAVSDYTVKTELNENRLYIVNAAIKDNSEKFQIGYEINFKAAEYESPLPVLSVLTKMYNQLIEDTRILHSYIRKQCFVADGKEQALVLPGLPAHTVWCMGENGKMFALPVSELYGKFNQMVEALKKEFEKVLIAGADEALIEIIKKFKEETDKQLGILAGAGSAFKPKQVANIEILKNVNAKVDEVYEVLGYYRFDDGATHKRKIAREDDGSGVQLANKLWANILHDGELHVEWFGTIGDGSNEQTIFNKISSYIQNSSFTDLKLIFPYGKTFEYGDQYERETHAENKTYYITVDGINIKKENLKLIIDLNNCTFIKKKGLRFGSFNPLTGEKHPSSGYFINPAYNTSSPTFIRAIDLKSFTLRNGTILGSRKDDIIGGTWGDTGWQTQNSGLWTTNIREEIILENLIVKDFNLDGLYVNGLGSDKYIRTYLNNIKVDNCGRQGITLAGGRNMLLDNVTITNIGVLSEGIIVASNPKSGIDVENESAGDSKYLTIINSHIENCGNNCIVNDGTFEKFKIKRMVMHNTKLLNKNQGNIFFLKHSDYSFYNCVFVGKFAILVNENEKNCNAYNCVYSDDITNYSILGETGTTTGRIFLNKGINFYNSVLYIKSKFGQFPFDTFENNYYNCKIYKDDPDAYLTGNVYGSDILAGNINELFGNSKVQTNEIISLVMHTNKKLKSSSPKTIKINQYYATKTSGVIGDIDLLSVVASNGVYGYICSQTGEKPDVVDSITSITLSGIQDSNEFTLKMNKTAKQPKYIQCSALLGYGIKTIQKIIKQSETDDTVVYQATINAKSTKTQDDVVASVPKVKWSELRYYTEAQALNTMYMGEKMKEEGVYSDFITYMDKKTLYDKQQQNQEKQSLLAYQEVLKENPDLTYEEFLSMQPITLNLIVSEEPQPSEALKKFMEKYL